MNDNKFEVSSKMLNNFKETGKWALFLSIIGFVVLGLFLIVGLIIFITTIYSHSYSGVIAIIPLLITCSIMFFQSYFLFKFASSIQKAIKSNITEDYEIAFTNLKIFFKFMGIMVIVTISIYLLVFIGGAFVSTIGSMNY